MTVIFLCKGEVFTDSAHYIERERFVSLTKVTPLKQPLKVSWEPEDGMAYLDAPRTAQYWLGEAVAFTDTIHGWTGTGYHPSMEAAIKALVIREGSITSLWKDLYQSMALQLINSQNHYTLILLGEKANYTVSIEESNLQVTTLSRDEPCAFGSGATAVIRHYMTTGADPVKAMYHTFLEEPTCGGMIDCWRLPTVEDPLLYRRGIGNEYTGNALMERLRSTERLELDFIHRRSSAAIGDALYTLGALSTLEDTQAHVQQGWIGPKVPGAITHMAPKKPPTRKRSS